MLKTSLRWLAPAVLVMAVLGCDGRSDNETTAGILTEQDMPFEPTGASGDIDRPPILTQLATSCIGIEQDVLYDDGWTVEARQYFDLFEWTVISAVFHPESPDTDVDAELARVVARHEECVDEDGGSTSVESLAIDGGDFAYLISDASGDFDAARVWKSLGDDGLAQVSLMKLPDDASARDVLQDLIDRL